MISGAKLLKFVDDGRKKYCLNLKNNTSLNIGFKDKCYFLIFQT